LQAEWDFGGLPAWLASSAISGGGSGNGTGDYTKMKLRSADPLYLHHVDRWWRVLLPRIAPKLRIHGGPILMVQIENEFGLCNNGNDPVYLRHLTALAKTFLGKDQILFTTDPAHAAEAGSLPGDEVFTAVDFGPQWFQIDDYFSTQRLLNAPTKAPSFDSEFYTGWLSHWGEAMANTSSVLLAQDTDVLLRYGNNTGSFNFYMAHGGTNFGFWQGANAESDGRYEPHITSYDYDSPISEAGQTCQPGIGVGDGCKFMLVREVIEKYTGVEAPAVPPEPCILGYGDVELKAVGKLMDAAEAPIVSDVPLHMEEYGQQRGLIIYRTELEISSEKENLVSSLNFVVPPSDYASVLINGELQGRLVRGGAANLTLPALEKEKLLKHNVLRRGTSTSRTSSMTLDVIVEAMGRRNFGCDPPLGAWDTKGLQSTDIRLDGKGFFFI
jgi:beta-galactosidase